MIYLDSNMDRFKMDRLNIGDNVIITKRICNIKAVKGVVCHIGKSFYGVKHGRPNSSGMCNIFINHSGETIELDIQEQRDSKINKILND